PTQQDFQNELQALLRRRRTARQAVLGSMAALLAGAVCFAGLALAFGVREQDERKKAEQLSASLAQGKGLSLCEQGDTAGGMLWLAHSLKIAPAGATDFQKALRDELGARRAQLHALTAVQSAARPARATVAAISPDGRLILTGGDDGTAQLWERA